MPDLRRNASPENMQNIPQHSGLPGDVAHWYAIRTRSRFEATTSAAFRDRGFTEFLPTYLSRRQWSDRIKELRLPLFPGYVFCRFDASDPYRILNSPGVVHIVGAGGTPLPVDDIEIEAVRRICEAPLSSLPWLQPVAGERVTIRRGPLRGVEGTFVRMKDQCRLVVSISLLMRSVSTELDLDWVSGAWSPGSD